MNDSSLIATADIRNDIYTLCELLHCAYRISVTYTNIANGFKGCGVWCAVRWRSIPEVIRCGDISNCEPYGSRAEALEAFKELSESFM